MLPSRVLCLGALLTTGTTARGSPASIHLQPRAINDTVSSVCQSLNSQTSVYGPLSVPYTRDTAHYMVSSYQAAVCLVAPKTAEELSTVMKVIAARRVFFAVSAGGHASNQGFSSTTGVHITLNALTLDGTNGIRLSADQTEITYTPGRVWDSLYEFMAQNAPSRQIVGGRVSGVGVGGFVISGGGYSWLSNQYGLTIDTLLEVRIVLPNGTITTASPSTNPDLFFGIRGGGNQFGIVTSLRAKTFPTGSGNNNVHGGIRIFDALALSELANATVDFTRNNKDPRAVVLPTFNAIAGVPNGVLLQFYDGETPPPGTFAAFDNMKSKPIVTDIKTRPWLDLIKSAPADATAGTRGVYHTVSTRDYSPAFMDAVLQQVSYYVSIAALHSASFVSYDIEPFVSTYFDHSQGGAYPHESNNGRPFLPTNLYVSWTNPAEDTFWHDELKKSADHLLSVAASEDPSVLPQIRYPNYAIADTPVAELYGKNVPALRALRRRVDPDRVMDLTGGFRVPF